MNTATRDGVERSSAQFHNPKLNAPPIVPRKSNAAQPSGVNLGTCVNTPCMAASGARNSTPAIIASAVTSSDG